jgi:uncharacterized membrane protein
MDAIDPMPLACPFCAARMPQTAAFCPGCGVSMQAPARATGKVGPLPETVAGALAYLTFIPAIVFLVLKPYNQNLFVRFHSVQCLVLWAAALLAATLLRLAGFLLVYVPVVGPLFAVLVAAFAGLAFLLLWLVLVVKAFQGEMFKLPFVGNFAEQYASTL